MLEWNEQHAHQRGKKRARTPPKITDNITWRKGQSSLHIPPPSSASHPQPSRAQTRRSIVQNKQTDGFQTMNSDICQQQMSLAVGMGAPAGGGVLDHREKADTNSAQEAGGEKGASATGKVRQVTNDVAFVLRKLYTGGGLDAQQQGWECLPVDLFNTLTLQLGTMSKVGWCSRVALPVLFRLLFVPLTFFIDRVRLHEQYAYNKVFWGFARIRDEWLGCTVAGALCNRGRVQWCDRCNHGHR